MSTEFPDTAAYARLEHASRRYGPVTALNDVSLDIYPGEVVALLGPNGAGKTTLVNLLLGLIRSTSGRAELFGGPSRAPENISRVGVMLQSSGVPETLKVWELVDQFSSYYPYPLSVAEAVAAVGLDGLEGRLFGKLSGGQKQRLLFALALCGNPQLLFLDEPTVGLDVESRRSFWQQIRSFSGKGRSVLLTTHYLEEADALADRVIVLDKGRIIAQGSTDEIKGLAAGRRIRCTTNLAAEEVLSWNGVSRVDSDSGTLEIFATSAEPVVLRLLQADPRLSDLEVMRAALEDAFLALTRAQAERLVS